MTLTSVNNLVIRIVQRCFYQEALSTRDRGYRFPSAEETKADPSTAKPSRLATKKILGKSFQATSYEQRIFESTNDQPTAECFFRSCSPATSRRIRRFASHGGPDLCDLRGYRSSGPEYNMSAGALSLGRRKRGAQPAVKISGTPNTTTTKDTGPYDVNFQQHLTNNRVFPFLYYYRDGKAVPPPDNIDEIKDILERPRPSLSPSQFSESEFYEFQVTDTHAAKQAQVMARVIPIIKGKLEDPRCAAGQIPFRNLDNLTDGSLVPGNPDLYYGARPDHLQPKILDKISGQIVPSAQDDVPVAPNFFLHVKGPNGSLAVASRQACYDGALGARGIHSLQSYGLSEPHYDNKAYTLTSIYHGGCLNMYASHPIPPPKVGERPGFAMTQINTWCLTGSPGAFRQGAAAYRNGRDWAERQRDDAIRQANGTTEADAASLSDDSASSSHSDASVGETMVTSQATALGLHEPETSADELSLEVEELCSISSIIHIRRNLVLPTRGEATAKARADDSVHHRKEFHRYLIRQISSSSLSLPPLPPLLPTLLLPSPWPDLTTINRQKQRKKKNNSSFLNPGSSPSTFMVSAPGKVIVFGEHSVVYDKSAIAATISLRSYLHVTSSPSSSSNRTVTLDFPNINLAHQWSIDDLPWASFRRQGETKEKKPVTSLDPLLVAALQPHVVVCVSVDDAVRKVQHSALSAFLYLLLSLHDASSVPPACRFTLRSTIPIGAGLGSSASISVCLAAAILHQLGAIRPPSPDQTVAEARAQVERINDWAFVGEMCIHGNPSGVDNTVVSHGRAVLYRHGHGVRPLWNFPQLPLLLVDTRQEKSTAHEVAKVAALSNRHPDVVKSLLEAMDQVTNSADILLQSRAIQAPKDSPSTALTTATHQETIHLGDLMRINHGLLVSLGVSHPRIERVRDLVDHQGLGWTKLTGSGGGGCCIALKRPSLSEDDVSRLNRRLVDEDYRPLETTLAGDGVGILLLHPVDVDAFLAAETEDDVEALVGRDGVNGKGWKFWGIDG
ncbi:hypothetical protein L249_7663 [Ophiocordyceps polyrhachis-furcata BCC 54312]|uniref:mevalonate kinase n=1 Tax=Ophiocordyceps polyrhachis-furcata BCC 54312 TaxID=1330021 RepID=A0A367LAB2_9HYPO|nr:hypothetical protein L249_7663 [Ophiocordyceps polyrhachis-furcata BCC 54312]